MNKFRQVSGEKEEGERACLTMPDVSVSLHVLLRLRSSFPRSFRQYFGAFQFYFLYFWY